MDHGQPAIEKSKNVPVVIAGSGRSGTSWLLDMLAVDKNIRPIFEPLHGKNVPNARTLWNLYLRAGDEHPQLERHIRNVFEHRAEKSWYTWMHCRIDHSMSMPRKLRQLLNNHHYFRVRAKRRMVKMIKANLCLDWLMSKFEMQLIFLRRHPCAVLASRLKTKWNPKLTRFLKQERLCQDFLGDRRQLIDSALNSREKSLVVYWCIENGVPQYLFDHGLLSGAQLSYENMVKDCRTEMPNLLNLMGYGPEEGRRWLDRILRTHRPKIRSLYRWKDELPRQLIDFTQKSAIEFGICLTE